EFFDQRVLGRLKIAAMSGFVEQRACCSVCVRNRGVIAGAESGFGRHLLAPYRVCGRKVPLPQVSSMTAAQGSSFGVEPGVNVIRISAVPLGIRADDVR